MGKREGGTSWKRLLESILIWVFSLGIIACTAFALMFYYRPNHNALGALGTVCMDVISMGVLLILVLSFAFEKEESSRTTRLYIALMLGTIWGLFLDLLVWASDGMLKYGDWTFAVTLMSLCGGPILAAIFVLYLGSYLDGMYRLRSVMRCARICFVCNILSLIVTFIFGLTGNAFSFVDGHYMTTSLYEIITVIPILTLFFMTGYAICHVRIIGLHDVIAVCGYILTMVIGASIESAYNIGATYVSISIADIFIFLLLQNKMINRMRQQREELTEEVTSQYQILGSMAGIYSHVNYVDIENRSAKRFDVKDSEPESLNLPDDPHTGLNKGLYDGIEDELKAKFWAFTDLSTLEARMSGEKIISGEFCHKEDGWFRAQYIRIGNSLNEPITRVIYSIQNIDEEKKNVEKWIRKSNTDELTGFFNRHAYEDEVTALDEGRIKSSFVYVSMDVNSLKLVNDSLGHEAGDELLVGACECMRQCFGSYGKLYRTGGDEFAALIFADDSQLREIKKDFEEITENWSGKIVNELAISCGYVAHKEVPEMALRQMAVLADKRMYEAKTKYYQKKGIDRRGQRDAHVALCAMYTKIIKINIAEDTYQIINMDEKELTPEMGFSESLSTWMHDFGTTGQVHPDDLEGYLKKTSLEYLGNHFRESSDNLTVFYRRRYGDTFRLVMMEIIPANDYTDNTQSLFLFVKDIDQ